MKSAIDWRDALSALLPDSNPEEGPASISQTPPLENHFPLQKLRIDIERKGRGGKTATIISGFTLNDSDISEIATVLKRKLGTGGSSRGGEILIQGDRRNDVEKELRNLGIIK